MSFQHTNLHFRVCFPRTHPDTLGLNYSHKEARPWAGAGSGGFSHGERAAEETWVTRQGTDSGPHGWGSFLPVTALCPVVIMSAVPKRRGRGHVIIAVPNCDLSSLLKNHAMCPGGCISPIVHSHDPKRSPFFLVSSHSRFPCSQKMSLPYTSHAFCGASTDFPSLILITPLSPPSLLSKEGVALPTL